MSWPSFRKTNGRLEMEHETRSRCGAPAPFIRRYYPNDTVEIDGTTTTITFPTPRVRKVSYDLEVCLPGFFKRFEHALEGPQANGGGTDREVLTRADPGPVRPSRYARRGPTAAHRCS